MEELTEINGLTVVTNQFTYGNDLISQRQLINGQRVTSFYLYDGHGSVRFLTDSNGVVTDSYDYDAFGNLINSVGSTPNNYLYAGEQFDHDLNLYYNRARYLSTEKGRFWTMDHFEGNKNEPLSFHKYIFAHANPINGSDPSGRSFITDIGDEVHDYIALDFEGSANIPAAILIPPAIKQYGQKSICKIFGLPFPRYGINTCRQEPDLVAIDSDAPNSIGGRVWEIRPRGTKKSPLKSAEHYKDELERFDPKTRDWELGEGYKPPEDFRIYYQGQHFNIVSEAAGPGVIEWSFGRGNTNLNPAHAIAIGITVGITISSVILPLLSSIGPAEDARLNSALGTATLTAVY